MVDFSLENLWPEEIANDFSGVKRNDNPESYIQWNIFQE